MYFKHDPRLGIDVPNFLTAYEDLPKNEQEDVLLQWEIIRSRIPDQIVRFEHVIEEILDKVHHEEDWDVIADHFSEIADYASRIHELNTWRRVDPSLAAHVHVETAAEHRDREK